MFKRIFLRIFQLVSKPAKAWHSLANDELETDQFLSGYLYPIFGIITLTAFLGVFMADKAIEPALKVAVREFVSFFAGFYLASFLLNEVMKRVFEEVSMKRCRYFVAYASSLIYIIAMVVSLFNGFGLLYLFLPYTIYIIWEGAIPFLQIKEDDQVKFTAVMTVIILVPYLVMFIINKFMLITPVDAVH